MGRNLSNWWRIQRKIFVPYSTLDPWLVRTDRAGGLIWEHAYGPFDNGAKEGFILDLVETEDDTFIAAGYITGGASRQGLLIQVDSEGGMIRDEEYGGSDDEMIYAIFETQDGNYCAVGGSIAENNDDKHGWAILLDHELAVLDEQFYRGTDETYFQSGLERSDLGFVFTGRVHEDWVDAYHVFTDAVKQEDPLVRNIAILNSPWWPLPCNCIDPPSGSSRSSPIHLRLFLNRLLQYRL